MAGKTVSVEELVAMVGTHEGIMIVSGEGEIASGYERHTGARTVRAIKARLTRERCGGDRWAYAQTEGGQYHTPGRA